MVVAWHCPAPHKVLLVCSWVEGELLHLDGSGTRGAELGFVWNADKNSFLMAVLKRVNLNDRED